MPARAQGQAPANAPIKIAALLGFSGPASLQATSSWIALRMGVKEINDAGGLLGRRVELIQSDDQFQPAQAVNEARRLTQQEKVNFVFGPMASSLALAVAPIFNEAKTIYFSTSVAVIPTPYNFSPMMSTPAFAQAMARFARETLKPKSVAILSDNGAAAKSAVEEFKKLFPAQGIAITGIQEHDTRPPDVTPQVLALRKTNPDVLIHTTSTGEDAGLMINALRDLGWNIPVVSSSAGLAVGGALKIAGPDAFKSGRIYSTLPLSQTYCASDKPGERGFDKYVSRLRAFAPDDVDKMDQKSSLNLYDGLLLLKAAVEGAKSLDGATLISWMDQNATKVRGTTGAFFASTAGNHFMMGADAMAIVLRPDVIRPADKLVERVSGCS
jgi:branched-chain amino acid transport system substrate-binding protein